MSEEAQSKRGETPESEDQGGAGFRVIDRRRFAADGSERAAEDAARPSAPGSSGPSGSESAAETAVPQPQPEAAPGAEPSPAAVGPDFVMSESREQASAALPEATLSTLVLSLSTQALMHLGEIPDMATGKPTRDLPAARSIIDLLAVLQRKTEGNLDDAESALFERILYDLRMRFVQISRS